MIEQMRELRSFGAHSTSEGIIPALLDDLDCKIEADECV